MMNEDYSCIKEVTKVVSLILPSMYNTNEGKGICDALESWKRQYNKQLKSIVVGYKNVSLTSKRGYIRLDSPVIYCNVKATFELFYPTIGSIIKGKINRISQDYIGCLVHDTINVTIHRPTDISSDISRFIVLDNFILFQITRINFKSKFIHVKGKITEECIAIMKESGLFTDNVIICDNNSVTCASPDFSNRKNCSSEDTIEETNEFDTSTDNSSQTSSHKKKKKHKKSKDFTMSPSLLSESLENNLDQVELTKSDKNKKKRKASDMSNNSMASASPDFSDRKKYSLNNSTTDAVLETNEFDSSTDDSSQTSSHKKKKKHKISKDFTMSPSLLSESLENNLDQVELTQSNSSKKKHKASDVDLNSSTYGLGEKKVKTEMFIDESQTELDESYKNSRKRKRKKSDLNLSSSADLSEGETFLHPKKKVKTEEQVIWTDNTMETFSNNSKPKKNNISSITPAIHSPNIETENSAVKVEIISPVKKKKKSNNSLEEASFPDHVHGSEIKENDSSSFPFTNPQKISTSSDIKSEQYSLTSPDLFDESLSEEKNKELTKPKKKKEKESKSKSHKKSKDKLKKRSNKDKKKKVKVISTKKKLHGRNKKLKKKKNKDKKSKGSKKKKSKVKNVPE